MKKTLIIFILFVSFIGIAKSQEYGIAKYKNTISLDVGELYVLLNYHRRIFYKNWYALTGQVGTGITSEPEMGCIDIFWTIYSKAYINNIFIVKRNEFIAGLGVENVLSGETAIKLKAGYQYNIFRHLSLNLTLSHWIWTRVICPNENSSDPPSYISKGWISGEYCFCPMLSFGININF